MTSVHPTTPLFGRAPIRAAGRRGAPGLPVGDASDADYEDPRVIAANLERALRAARARLVRLVR
ncbi:MULTISPECIES: hypothetical protein [unclassified Curtobacterium]|uniref:hypothetical protein n=1 Tax=unclassified Curtobacterium TaxID=257496 RepID=UPI00380E866F